MHDNVFANVGTTAPRIGKINIVTFKGRLCLSVREIIFFFGAFGHRNFLLQRRYALEYRAYVMKCGSRVSSGECYLKHTGDSISYER